MSHTYAVGRSVSSLPFTFHTASKQTAVTPVLAAVEAEPHLRLALETRLCSTLADQSSEAVGQTHGLLLLDQAALPDDAVLAEPGQHRVTKPAAAGQCIAPEAPQGQLHAETSAIVESAQQHPAASGACEAHQASSDAALAPACNSVKPGISRPKNALELPQQAPQEVQQDNDIVTGAGAASLEARQGQPEYVAGAVQRQDSSSMVSLSPSLKLDIPGLDDILSSDLLTENDGQATSQLQPHLHQVSPHNQHHVNDHHHDQQQQSVDQQQFADLHQQQQQQQQQSVDQHEPKTDEQQESVQHSAYPAGPEDSQGTPDDHHVVQSALPAPAHQEPSSRGTSAKSQAGATASSGQGMPCQQAEVQTASKLGQPSSDIAALEDSIADGALAARQHLLAAGSQGPSEAVIQSPAGHLASLAHEGGSAAGQADSLPDCAKHQNNGPAQSATVGTTDGNDGSSKSDAAARSHSTASHPTLEDGGQASALFFPFSQHAPSSDHDRMKSKDDSRKPGQLPATVATEQVSAATDLHTEPAADCPATAAEQKVATKKQPQSLQQASMTASQQVC